MAKRLAPEEKPWNPVEDKLAHDVLRPPAAVAAAAEPKPPAPVAARVVSIETRKDQPSRSTSSEAVKEAEKLSREKRVLLTEGEEDTLEQLVKDMGRKLGTPLKLSHILRATVTLLMHSREELIKQGERMGGMKRPPNNDPAALATFEHNLARLIDRAIRGSSILE